MQSVSVGLNDSVGARRTHRRRLAVFLLLCPTLATAQEALVPEDVFDRPPSRPPMMADDGALSPTLAVQPENIQRTSTSELESQARQLIQANEFVQAIPFLQELARRFDEASSTSQLQVLEDVLFYLGVGYMQNEDFARASQTFTGYLARFAKNQRVKLALEFLADSYRLNGQYVDAAESYAKLRKDHSLEPAADLDVLSREAGCYVSTADWETAFPLLEELFARARSPQMRGEAATALVMAYVGLDRENEITRVLPVLMASPAARHNVNFNLALIQGGDKLFTRASYPDALMLYRLALSKEQMTAWLDLQFGNLQGQYTAAVTELDFKRALALRGKMKELKSQKEELRNTEDFSAHLRFRIAQTFYEMGQSWEALWTYWTTWLDYHDSDFAEDALFAAYSLAGELMQYDRALDLGITYVTQFKNGNYYDDASLMLAQIYLTKEDFKKCIETCRHTLEEHPEHSYADQLHFMIGYSYFQLEEFDEALKTFRSLQSAFSEGSAREPCDYWIAMTLLYKEAYAEAIDAFNEFSTVHPGGIYFEDAQFRVPVCDYGLGDFARARSGFEDFIRVFPDSPLRAECHMFLGDIAGAQGRLTDAIKQYEMVEQFTEHMARVDYAAFQIGTILELRGDYKAMAEYFRSYLEKYRMKGNYAEAVWRIGFAKEQMGDFEGMHRLYENAMVRLGDDPTAVGIDHIMATYPESYLRHHGKEPYPIMMDMLQDALTQKKKTLALRLMRSIANLAVAKDKPPPVFQEKDLDAASPAVLVWIGEKSPDNADLARKAFGRVLDRYGETEWVEPALINLAEMAMQGKDYSKAISLFEDVLARFPDGPDAGRAMKRQADALLALGKPDAARDVYLQILEVKEWRGPLWPECLYQVGISLLQQGQFREAFAYFQRIYVLYQGYPEWMVRGYLKSGLCLEMLNRRPEAVKTYEEMLGIKGASDMPEFGEAEKRLARLR